MTIPDRKLAPGTRLIVKYKQQEHTAEVIAGEDGQPRYRLADGREFRSPSSAGKAVMGGKACNGWRFWSVAGAKQPAASRPTSPNVPRSGRAGSTAPAARKAAHTARTARKAAQRSAPAKAKRRKTARKATKRTIKPQKR